MAKRTEATGAAAESNEELLKLFISSTVPPLIGGFIQQGGIHDWDIKWLESHVDTFASGGDVILCYEKHKTAKTIGVFCRCLAIMAFFPGGVTFLGMHFEAKQIEDDFERLRAHILKTIQEDNRAPS